MTLTLTLTLGQVDPRKTDYELPALWAGHNNKFDLNVHVRPTIPTSVKIITFTVRTQ